MDPSDHTTERSHISGCWNVAGDRPPRGYFSNQPKSAMVSKVSRTCLSDTSISRRARTSPTWNSRSIARSSYRRSFRMWRAASQTRSLRVCLAISDANHVRGKIYSGYLVVLLLPVCISRETQGNRRYLNGEFSRERAMNTADPAISLLRRMQVQSERSA